MNKIYLSILMMFASCFIACKKDGLRDASSQSSESFVDDSHASKMYFARTLAAALEKEPALRTFIKEEALKMFDKDYDVFYQLVSNKKLNNGETFYQTISKYANSKDSLNLVIDKLPLLTILVPELPNFNAELWNTNEVPSVAVEPVNTAGEDITAFRGNNTSFEIPRGLIPCFPTLVIKDNERVIFSKGTRIYAKAGNANKVMSLHNNKKRSENLNFLSTNKASFRFADEVFNGVSNSLNEKSNMVALASDRGRDSRDGENGTSGDRDGSSTPRPGKDGYVPPNIRTAPLSKVKHIIDAMNSSAEWPRDYIYYGIDPKNGKNTGVLKRNVQEYITSFRFANGATGFEAINNELDTKPVDHTKIAQQWTEGQYEFRITALINKKNGPGEQTEKIIYAKGSDLFEIYYDFVSAPQRGCIACPPTTYAKPRIGYAKIFQLPIPIDIDSWDLSESSFGWKFYVIKFSNETTVTESKTNTVEFANNFEINPQFGETMKIGAKFGSSQKTTNSQEYTISIVRGSSSLGDANIYFDKPIWQNYSIYQGYESRSRDRKGVGPLIDMVRYEPYEMFTGAVYLTIEPRVQ